MDRAAVGAELDTAVGDVISIALNSEDPGVQFEADRDGNAAVIKGWERASTGKFGLIQKHGGIHLNDVLFAVNDVPLDTMPHNDVVALLSDRNLMKKTLKFMSSSEYYRRKNATRSTILAMQEAKNNFLSIVRRARIAESAGNKYVEYEIACQMRVMSQHVQKEVIHKWSVWKRYSEFELLHREIRKNLGWQMQNIELPPSHTFVINKFSADFIEQRRSELDAYWQRVLSIDKITEFTKHHCSVDIKQFINVDATLNDSKTILQSSNNRELAVDELRREDLKTGTMAQDPPSSPLKGAASSGMTRTLASLRRRAVRGNGMGLLYPGYPTGGKKSPAEVSISTTAAVDSFSTPTSAPAPPPATAPSTYAGAAGDIYTQASAPPPPPPLPQMAMNPPPASPASSLLAQEQVSQIPIPPAPSPAPAPAVIPPVAMAPARMNMLGAIKALRKYDD